MIEALNEYGLFNGLKLGIKRVLRCHPFGKYGHDEIKKEGKTIKVASGMVPALKPYEKTDILLSAKDVVEEGKEYDLIVTLYSGKKVLSTFNLKKKVLE